MCVWGTSMLSLREETERKLTPNQTTIEDEFPQVFQHKDRQNFPNVLLWHHNILHVLENNGAGSAQHIFGWHHQKTAASDLLESRKWSCVIFPARLSPWTITGGGGGVLLNCLDNMKGACALISIKTVIVLNYLYDCPLELLSMLFSLSSFSKSLSSGRRLCEANTMQPVDSPQKGIALESHTSAGWPLAVWGARSNPCGHPVRSSLGNRIDSKCVIVDVHISEHPSKWHLTVFSLCTCECCAWVGEMLKPAFGWDHNLLPDLTQKSKCFSFCVAKSMSLYSGPIR